MTDEIEEPETSLALMTLALAGVAIAVMVLIFAAQPADGGTVCLTYKQARHLWPKVHLFWYGRDHCWSNRRGPPRNLHIDPVDPVFPKRAMTKEVMPNETDRGIPAERDNKKGPRLSGAEEDRCCWPQLDRDANANVIELPRSFIDRWQDQPWLGRIGQ